MGKEWDKALPKIEIWKECLRVLKPGAFTFVMCAPRQDVLSRQIINLEEAGFKMGFTSIYWSFASGFPKAGNIGKLVDKRLGKERKVVGKSNRTIAKNPKATDYQGTQTFAETAEGREASKYITAPASKQAKALDGSYAGFHPKPAVEIILVAMKPCTEKTYIDQAMKNRKGITWLDDCRVPYEGEGDRGNEDRFSKTDGGWAVKKFHKPPKVGTQGRFPANLIISDNVVDDGKVRKSPSGFVNRQARKSQVFTNKNCGFKLENLTDSGFGDSGGYSRYFSLDAWWQDRLKALPESVRRTFDNQLSKAYNKDKNNNLSKIIWEAKKVEEDLGLKRKNIDATGAKKESLIMKVTEKQNITSVQKNAMQALDSKSQNRNVESVEKNVDYIEIDIVQSIAQIKQDMEILLKILKKDEAIFIKQKKDTLFSQANVDYVEEKVNYWKDIIQTLISQPKLYGFVGNAIIGQMQQDFSQDQLWQTFWQNRVKKLSLSHQKTFPFAVISKASKGEKNKGCEGLDDKKSYYKNNHPTVKPLTLISYLITLGSRPNDIVLDPFVGSGTTCIAAKTLKRKWIGIEQEKEYCEIANARIKAVTETLI